MKKITMFTMESCPYCREALRFIEILYGENKRYRDIPFERIDEKKHPEVAEKYDYYYVPTFYVGETKLHEGASDLQAVRRVFDAALNS